MNTYLRLITFLYPYKLKVCAAVLCMMLYALTNGAMAFIIGPVMKHLFTSGTGEEVNIIPYNLFTLPKEAMIFAVPLAIIFVGLAKGLSSFGHAYFMGFVGQRVVTDMRTKLYKHILTMPLGFFTNTPTGILSSRLTNDVNMVQAMTADSLARILKHGLSIIVLIGVVVSMDWKLAIAAFVTLPLAIYPMARLGSRIKKISTKGQVKMGTMTALLQEAITGIRIVKAFCMEGYESDRFSDENERYTKYQLKSIAVKAISSPITEFISSVGFAITIWYATVRIGNGTLAPEAFISFFAAVLLLFQPIKALNGITLNIQTGISAAIRVFELIDTSSEEVDSDGTKPLNAFTDSIVFKDVNFKYGDKPVLNDINMTIKKGEVNAIVGMSGAGKSTLVNLIPRFFETTEGTISIDGTNIRELQLKALRGNIAVVSQHVILFNDTIKNNIAYGNITKDSSLVEEAAKSANAHDFICALPEGYDTIIGESGIKLSGGERQRLSIARAILKDSPILIMDEATSSLDTHSELEVQSGLARLMKGRTTFVIAHRLSTIKNAHKIIVLKEGRIIETGGHEELLAKDGEYTKLYNIQVSATNEE
ncbi:MAG: ATP-binding cassette domain-containing protein [Proteobacteria bacterium]|nr:ATP-binding cassette domain-containing protein [Pseudomonadota bacterium]